MPVKNTTTYNLVPESSNFSLSKNKLKLKARVKKGVCCKKPHWPPNGPTFAGDFYGFLWLFYEVVAPRGGLAPRLRGPNRDPNYTTNLS